MGLSLEQRWLGEEGGLVFRILNGGQETLRPARLCLSVTVWPAPDATVRGGRLERVFGTLVEIALDVAIPPGGAHEVAVDRLLRAPANRTHGALAAWFENADGTAHRLRVGDLAPPPGRARGPLKDWPDGRIDLPVSLLPWAATVDVSDFGPAPLLSPAPGTDPTPFAHVAALHRRLFRAAPSPFAMEPAEASGTVVTRQADALPPDGYRIAFGDRIVVAHRDAGGLCHGLTALAQMAHAARTDPRFGFPRAGVIEDAPRFGWRGCHLDVARNVFGAGTVLRLLDVMAWLRMNRLHWHLTDDEGWRLPSRAFPTLATIGARRVRGGPLPPQYADGPDGQAGHYAEADIAAVLARAASHGIAVMPEIDMPGHCTALLASIPGLRDPGETPGSYRSVQGFPDNALNPALPQTYEVVRILLDELARLFPDAPLHVGGDEVDAGSWTASPLVRDLARTEGLDGTQAVQAHFMRRLHGMVAAHGRVMGAWDEAADGGGVRPEGTLLFAWRSVGKTAALIARGYDVVATPGQAYYLDMQEAEGWDNPGAAWAGVSTPEGCYALEPAHGLPDGPGRLVGVQAGIWTEYVDDVAKLNALAFPRLAAVAEAAWTPPEAKSWPRFAALSRLVPQL